MMEDNLESLDLRTLALKLGMQIADPLVFDAEIALKIPYSFAKRNSVLPVEENDSLLTIAIADPLNLNALEDLHLMFNKEVKALFCPEDKILSAIHECYHHKEGSTSRLLANLSQETNGRSTKEKESLEAYDLLEIKDQDAPIIKLLNSILSEAIQQGASDIHFEPFEKDLKIRYRVDGVLKTRHCPAVEYQSQMLTRIKVMAKLDIAEHRLPQDGRIKLKMGGREIDFRVSTVPVVHGERIVLRILDKGNVILGLDKLGLLPAMLDEFRSLISLSEGIVLVTGPTGSGKTTTLYSAIWEILSDEYNILTVEDPVEYKLLGIGQIGIQPKIGLTFAAGLRHILRQDPDVIMIGEIRDAETAEIAIQAALTGHLVLSTLHTNDAPSAIVRLVDMGIEPFLLSSSIVGVLAQRLVRTICSQCREGYPATDQELFELGLPREHLNSGMIYRGKGCPHCFGTGYKGRHGVYELLRVDSTLQTQIAKNIETSELRSLASKRGMTTLRAHGAHLVRSGVTTISEVLRVTRKYL